MEPGARKSLFPPELVAAARAAKAAHAKELRRYPNVCGLGVGFKVKAGRRQRTLAIRVYVTKKVPLGKLKKAHRLPRSIEGIPVDVIVQKPHFHLFDPYNPSPEHAARRGVLLGGISIGVSGTGTLGGSCFDNSTLMDAMLTNWHVACDEENCSEGVVVQPSAFDSPSGQRVVGRVLRSRVSPEVDAAVLGLNGAAFLQRDVLSIGPLGRVAPAEVGMQVLKAGRTSGVTSGTITDVAHDLTSCDSDGENCHDHVDQIEFEGDDGMAQPGDSGSLLVDTRGSVVGLVFAANEDGDEVSACHIQDVLNALNVNLTTGMTQQDLIAATHALDA